MIVTDFLIRNARRQPHVPGLIVGGQTLTWGQMLTRVNKLGNAFLRAGIGPGSPVGMLLANSAAFVEAHYALCQIGAISAPIMPRSTSTEIGHILNDIQAQALITDELIRWDGVHSTPTLRLQLDVGGSFGGVPYEQFVHDALPDLPNVAFDDRTIGSIKYTSGTTGSPKGCARTHDRRALAALSYVAHVPYYESDRCSINSPLAAGFGLALLDAMFCGGATVHMLPKFDATDLLETIEREKITRAYAIESTFNKFTRHPELDRFDLSSLRLFTGASASQDTMLGFRRLREHPTFKAGFFNAYGSTEAGGSVTFNFPQDIATAMSDPDKAMRVESVGREGYGCRIECLDEDLRPLPPGEIGELAIKAPTVFAGYLNRPEETQQVLHDGWLITGDMALKDADGFVFLTGRKRDMIKTGGINVYPAEIEYLLATHEKVAEVAVVGIPDQHWGEMVVACIVTSAPCESEEIMAFCQDKIAGYKKPKQIEFLDDLPRNSTGKIVKRELREMLIRRAL